MHETARHRLLGAGEDVALGRGERVAAVGCAVAMGVGALFGGWGLLTDAHGLGVEEAWLRWPFRDYTIPGLFLLVVIGGGMLATALLALRRAPTARRSALALGAILLAWLVIESTAIGYHGPSQLVLLATCSACAIVLVRVGLRRP